MEKHYMNLQDNLSEYQFYMVNEQLYKKYDTAKLMASFENRTIYLIELDLNNEIIRKVVVE